MGGSSIRGWKPVGGACSVGINVLYLNFFIFFLIVKHYNYDTAIKKSVRFTFEKYLIKIFL